MNKLSAILLSVVLSVGLSYVVATHYTKAAPQVEKVQTVYERVLSTGTLRCGFFEEAPFTIVDPNTGKKTGIAIELAEKLASELGLKLEWQSVANFGTMTEDLRNGRFDAICASLFNLPRAGHMDYTIPYTYVPVYGVTQQGRTEFDNSLATLDWSKVSIAGLDGEGATTIARQELPTANFTILPQSAQIADMLTSVADKKSDIAFVMPTVFRNFDANNPNRLRRIASDKPFYVFNVGFGIKPDEPAFKNMLDFMMRNLAANGYLQSLFDRYDPDGLLFRPQALYKAAQ